MDPRPGEPHRLFVTPKDEELYELLGGQWHEGVSLTQDQLRALNRLYEMAPVPPGKEQYLLQAGADRNMFRHAEHDGLRLLAWLAKWVEPGTDPLKVLVQVAVAAGWNVDPEDAEWAE